MTKTSNHSSFLNENSQRAEFVRRNYRSSRGFLQSRGTTSSCFRNPTFSILVYNSGCDRPNYFLHTHELMINDLLERHQRKYIHRRDACFFSICSSTARFFVVEPYGSIRLCSSMCFQAPDSWNVFVVFVAAIIQSPSTSSLNGATL
jgi:hypothetical protein